MTKLIIMIPCLNEESALPFAIASLPKKLNRIDTIERLIIDDGSTDQTVKIAKELGVEHILSFPRNMGLGVAFSRGIFEAAKHGADIVVNFDADCQYNADDIQKLIDPILDKQADYVIGERPINEIQTFSTLKKILQKLGSGLIKTLSNVKVKDTPSGYRALNHELMTRLYVFDSYTYTQETILTAAHLGFRVLGVPIRVNQKVLRESRLVKNIFSYICKAGLSYLKMYLIYYPLKVLVPIALVSLICFLILIGRFFYHYLNGQPGYAQSLIISTVFFSIFISSIMTMIVTQMIGINRYLSLNILGELRQSSRDR